MLNEYTFDYRPLNQKGEQLLDQTKLEYGPIYHDVVKPQTTKPQVRAQQGTLLWRQLNSVAFNDQVGGDHYKKLAIQPTEYAMANSLDTCQSNVVKYITRFRDKGGAKDLRKVLHYVEYLLETEYPNE